MLSLFIHITYMIIYDFFIKRSSKVVLVEKEGFSTGVI